MHADDRATIKNEMRTLDDNGRTASEQRYEVRRDVLWLQCEMCHLKEEEGGNGLLIGAVRDVTTRHELVEELRDSKDRFESTVLAAGLVLCDIDLGSRHVTFAGDCESALGQWPAELNGAVSGWIERMHAEDASRFERSLDEART